MNKKIAWYKSLAFSLVLWFLPISIIPILIISYDAYKVSATDLENTAYHDIEQAALLEKKFLQSWFHYRIIDIKNWSTREENILFLEELVDELHETDEPLKKYIESDEYLNTTIALEGDMLSLVRDYDYLYDLFLIDIDGNILYSVEKESDLGKNILEGKLGRTNFSRIWQETLKDEKIHFSDLELYDPSDGNVSGFITAPLYSTVGELIGVFAIQIKLDPIYDIFEGDKIFNKYFTHYLVGSDGLLRSKIYKNDEILKKRINTEQFIQWNKEHGNNETDDVCVQERIFEYIDPFGETVFGLHTNINILGVQWALISEAKIEPIRLLKNEIIQRTTVYIFIILIILLFAVISISRLIAKPITTLSEISEKFATGKRDIDLDIKSDGKNEVGLLTRRLIEMIRVIKKSENELDEQKYALNAHTIVSITDVKGTITYVNDKFVAISGYSREELIGRNHSILDSKDRSKEYWKDMYKIVANGNVWNDEVKNIAKNGSYFWFDTTIVPFVGEDLKPKSYISIRTDITDKKKDEAELIAAKAVAEESVRAKSEFFASMSHEIRTPMNGVIGMLGLLLNTELKDSQRHQAYLAKTSANNLLNLINDILDFSKVEAGKLKLDKQDFNIRKEVGDFCEAIALKAQEKGIEVVLDMTEVEMVMLHGDIGRILQILNNIVGNAIKFTSSGYVSIVVRLEKESEINSRLHISVKDSGIGIPEDKIAILFDSFSQVDATITRKYGGSGLGLAIVKKLCTLMNGEVSIKSEYGNGSEFIINIGLTVPSSDSTVLPRSVVRGKKVIIIDPCIISAEALKHQLEYWGMEVFYCQNKESLYSLSEENIELVFINQDTHSLSLFQEIEKGLFINLPPLVLMTSLREYGKVDKALLSNFKTHFPKPIITNDILSALNLLDSEKDSLSPNDKILDDMITTEWPKKMKILLVDDNLVNQLVANGILEEMGLEADVANDGLEALAALNGTPVEESYTIILMDCQMPNMDGYEATRVIKSGKAGETYRKIPIIAMTANAMEGDREKCLISGMDDYLSKPIDPEKLESMLRKYS